jgi:hypothetical protein
MTYILRTREPLLLSSMAELQAFHDEHGLEFVGELSKSWMGVPLLVANQVVGVMGIQSYEQETYTIHKTAPHNRGPDRGGHRQCQAYQQIVHLQRAERWRGPHPGPRECPAN